MAEAKPNLSADEMTALFAQLVLQQSNMAMLLLGRVPHPESGKAEKDLEAARLFIDQLEMLEVKTKGNLSPQENQLLGQSLMALRLAFVEAVDENEPAPARAAAAPAPQAGRTDGGEPAPKPEPGPAEPSSAEHRPKFSKKY
ncbi:DUF1844 domain-containing protein [bacterium]|nr:DUF1844 domain-containing protein [bacterium]